jgi:zona occludens toxin (predicted ATPase)
VVLPSISTDNRAVLSACFSASAARSCCGAHGFYSRRITLEDRCFDAVERMDAAKPKATSVTSARLRP